MTQTFCSNCGQGIRVAQLFCTHCGSPTSGFGVESGSSSPRPEATPLAGKSISQPSRISEAFSGEGEQEEPEDDDEELEDDQDDDEDSYVITEHDLNYLIVCSYHKAPLDSHVFLVREKKTGLRWLPASLFQSAENIEVIACTQVYFNIGWEELDDFCMVETDRDELSDDACDVIIDAPSTNLIKISLVFEPMRHDDLDVERPGKWVESEKNDELAQYKAILHLPIPGHVLKRKLLKHEAFIKELIQATRKTGKGDVLAANVALVQYETTLEQLDKAIKLMPDGAADHAYCVLDPGVDVIIKLSDEINQEVEKAGVGLRAPSAERAAEVLRARNDQPLANRTKWAAIARRGKPLLVEHPDARTAQDALDRIKKRFWPDS